MIQNSKNVKRKANRADIELYAYNEAKAEKSLEICKDIVKQYDLEMHLVSCEYTLDASKVIFMYTSETRVDFRELLKELASVFKCRIELRQIGPRDNQKLLVVWDLVVCHYVVHLFLENLMVCLLIWQKIRC